MRRQTRELTNWSLPFEFWRQNIPGGTAMGFEIDGTAMTLGEKFGDDVTGAFLVARDGNRVITSRGGRFILGEPAQNFPAGARNKLLMELPAFVPV